MRLVAIVLATLCLTSLAACADAYVIGSYIKCDIEQLGHENLVALKNEPMKWWVEAGTQLLLFTDDATVIARLDPFYNVKPELVGRWENTGTDLIVMWHVHNNTWNPSWNLNVYLYRHGFSVVLPRDMKTQHNILETVPNSRIFDQRGNLQLAVLDINSAPEANTISSAVPASSLATPIRTLVQAVEVSLWQSSVAQLATYNRFTSNPGNAAARTWITNQLTSNPGLVVFTEQYPVGSATGYNIIAKLTGTVRPDDWIIVGAHYDSTSQSTSTAAPGAEDNASGTAAVLEMARIFSRNPSPATIIFILFSGEEQGLYGSKFNANNIIKNGDKSKIKLVHTMDMIAFKLAANTKKVLIETSSAYSSWFNNYKSAAASYSPSLGVITSTNPFGSDHVPYINAGLPGILTIDADYDSYPHYHRTTDLPQYLTPDLAYDIIKMNVGVVASVAGYPSS